MGSTSFVLGMAPTGFLPITGPGDLMFPDP